MDILYTAEATSTGGREGHTKSTDAVVDHTLTVPKELGGDGKPGANPEKLFACGYSACFLGALRFVAGQAKVKIPPEATVSAKVGIGKRDDGQGFGITADLTIKVPGVEKDVVEDLVQKAHIVCPYSHAIKATVPVTLTVA